MSLIDVEPEVEHASGAAFGNDDIINRLPQKFFAELIIDVSRQQQSTFDIIFARENFGQMTFKFLCFNISEETESADIDAADGNILIGEATAYAQESTVAADRKSHIDVNALDARQTAIVFAKKTGVICLHDEPHVLIVIEIKNAVDDLSGASLAPIGENGNLHHARLNPKSSTKYILLSHRTVTSHKFLEPPTNAFLMIVYQAISPMSNY